jgi:hypothetical protein
MNWALPTAWVSINGYTDLQIPVILFIGGTWYVTISLKIMLSADITQLDNLL